MAFLGLAVGFFAYGTISVMFIWAFFGLIFGRVSPGSASSAEFLSKSVLTPIAASD
jgi:hypothetical protein